MQTDVPEGWERKPLGTVATIVGGTGFPTKHQGQTGAEFPFIKVSDMNLAGNERTVTWSTNSVTQDTLKLLGATAHPVGTTIFPKVGAALLTNKRRLLGVPATFDNNVMGVIARHADSDFVFHWTCTLDFANHVQLGALPSINQATVSSLPILLPPLPEQRKIAAILSSVDEAIQATQAVIEQTRRVKEGLLQELLTKGIGHTRFKKTPIGEIPEGWEIQELSGLCSIAHGYAFKSEFFTDSRTEYHLLTPGNFSVNGGYQPHKNRFYSGEVPEEYVLDEGDLLVTMTDLTPGCQTLGLPMRVPAFPGFSALHNQRLGRLTVDGPDKLSIEFLECFLLSKPYRDRIKATASGSTVRHTSPTRILASSIPLPSKREQQKIASAIKAPDQSAVTGETSLRQLRKLKQGLLQDLLTGKVRVSV